MATLGYAFWHAARADVAVQTYEDACTDWQRALGDHPSEGLTGGRTWRLDVAPWLVGWPPVVYLDLYTVVSFAALGRLNDAAVAGVLRSPHDAAARLAARGTAALYRRASPVDTGPGLSPQVVSWHTKPAGTAYPEAIGALAGPGRTVWLRQLTLGPGPELLVTSRTGWPGGPDGAGWSAVATVVAEWGEDVG